MKELIADWKERVGLKTDLGIEIGEADDVAALLLLMIHKGFNSKAWGKNLQRYWGAFEEKIELHLGAQDLAEFASKFAADLRNDIGRNQRQRLIAAEVAYCQIADKALERLRINHKMLVTLVRVMKDQIKADYDNDEREIMEVELS